MSLTPRLDEIAKSARDQSSHQRSHRAPARMTFSLQNLVAAEGFAPRTEHVDVQRTDHVEKHRPELPEVQTGR